MFPKGPGDYNTKEINILSKKANSIKLSFFQAKKGINYKKVEATNKWFAKFGPP